MILQTIDKIDMTLLLYDRWLENVSGELFHRYGSFVKG